eukprot:CAMPEP_0198110094 /NCGR_PEP_ID=MMETSP1442-20131203/2126_1 /TAXON_ID= /ORGANISM="Craspedostauros australis, Strain CCMP3328" /LENGTH=305 /DNA_ID=CAMNT_0043766019 /DNA_START=102 /DNA_END=1019 /DNA_ORIENTATION=+
MATVRQRAKKDRQKWAVLLPTILLTAMFVVQLQSTDFARNMSVSNKNTSINPSGQPILRSAAVAKTPRLKTQATPCQRQPAPGLHLSQSGEDKILMKWFKNLCGGTYIEMGALDGILFSNSHVFNKGLDWKGVLVEADPISYEKVLVNRPNELARIHAGVCLEEQDLHWVQVRDTPAVSGFLEFASEHFKATWWNKQLIDNALVVKCRRLDKILQEAVGDSFHFDFFSLDIEGAELLAVESLNFDQYQFGMILVEADGSNQLKDQSIKSILGRAGYDFVGTIERSNWFINKDFDLIYRDVVYGTK